MSNSVDVISKADTTIAPSYNEIVITADLLRATFDKNKPLDARALSLISWIGENRKASYDTNRVFLEQGDHVCPHLHEDMYGALLQAVESQIGFGKGIFTSTLMHMPERYARMKLALWKKQDVVLINITTHLRQAVLSHSVSQGRLNLAHDMASWMTALGEESYIKRSLSAFSRCDIEQGNLSGYLDAQSHVDILCSSKAYMHALSIGTDEALVSTVRKAMAVEIGATNSSWRGLLSCLQRKLADDSYDTETLVSRYKAVGSVLLEYIQGMDQRTRETELVDDDLRLMAFKLGVEEAIADVGSPIHKRQALEHSLSL